MRKRTACAAASLLAAGLIAASCTDLVRSERMLAPEFAVVQIAGGELHVPDGFTVGLFAEQLDGVRFLALGADGSVFATRSAYGEIVRLADANADGVADSRITVLSGLDHPSGLAFRGDTLYFAEQTTVKRLDPGAPAPVTIISNLPSGWHITRTIVFGPDDRLYLAMGSSCDVCDEPPPRAAVTRYNLDGSNPHTFATGLRNSVGLAFHPATGELWANNNDRENLGDELPPDRLNIIRDGRWYGWPQCHLPGRPNPEFPGADCSTAEPPALMLPAHSAPLGLAFYTGTAFPTEYQGDAFMSLHGSLDGSPPTGAKVVRVRVQNSLPTAVEDFVFGWQIPGGARWGRPVGLLVMPDGALLVSDDWGARIWRVTFGGSGSGGSGGAMGDLEVGAVTDGSDPDPDGYLAVVDHTLERALGVGQTIRVSGLLAGDHIVGLDGVAANCTVSGTNPQTVTVPAGGTGGVTFSVSCTETSSPPPPPPGTGDFTVATATTGVDIPLGFTFSGSGPGGWAILPIGANDALTFFAITAGDYTVALSEVAANCTVSGDNPRTVTVPPGGAAGTTFSVQCTDGTATTGDLEVSAATSGSSLDPDDYLVVVDGVLERALGINQTIHIAGLAAGGRTVELHGVAPNCTVGGANPRAVTVPEGGAAATQFDVSCVAP